MEQPAQKRWEPPELVVLVRTKPQEAVLTACKLSGVPPGPSSEFDGCGDLSEACYDMDPS